MIHIISVITICNRLQSIQYFSDTSLSHFDLLFIKNGSFDMSCEANQSIANIANKAKEELDNATAALEAAKLQLKDGKLKK